MIQIVSIEEARQDSAPTVIDGGIERHSDGRPKIYSVHDECGGTGRVPSVKRPGSTIKCASCKGTGFKGAFYSRTTTFIDVLEDKSNLAKWQNRSVALGLSRRPDLMEKVRAFEDPMGVDKSALDVVCKLAQDAANAGLKAELGTALHLITEKIDAGEDPGFIPEEFEADIAAYKVATSDLEIIGIETFCVLDEYKVAGTFDRLVRVYGELARKLGVPEGTLMIADIKTGGIEFGFGKIAMQLAGYSRMKMYDPKTYARSPLTHNGDMPHQEIAIVIHMPSGGGTCDIVPVDIAKGWEGLAKAQDVRDWRSHWARKDNKAQSILHVDGAQFV